MAESYTETKNARINAYKVNDRGGTLPLERGQIVTFANSLATDTEDTVRGHGTGDSYGGVIVDGRIDREGNGNQTLFYQDEMVSVQKDGVALVKLAGKVTRGETVRSNGAGLGVSEGYTSSAGSIGYALEDGVAGQYISVEIQPK